MTRRATLRVGFTLIELSIVLVIIGLITGGILVGQDLIAAAAIRSQITQIEKYNAAVNAFSAKYNGQIPGDMKATYATRFGFASRLGTIGHGNGDGLLEGYDTTGESPPGGLTQPGEPLMFWEDLSQAGFIDNAYTFYNDITANFQGSVYGGTVASGLPDPSYLVPSAKIGNKNFVFAGSYNGANHFFVQTLVYSCCGLVIGSYGDTFGYQGMTITQAYSIDAKIDDGLPTTGHVIAEYLPRHSGTPFFMNPHNSGFALPQNADTPELENSPPAPTMLCYNTTSLQYSASQTAGSSVSCALSFQFQ